jgi:membrane-associated protein
MIFDLINGLLQTLSGLSPAVLYLLTGVFTMLETSALVGLLVPGDAVVLLAGTTATSPTRFLALVTVAVAGSLAGESLGYLLGRRFGERLRSSRLGRRLGERNWAKAGEFLNGRGGRAVFAARFVAVVHGLLPVVAGTVRMPYRRFVGWAAAGSLAWSLLYVGAGAAAGASWREYGERLGMAGYLVLGILLAAALLARMVRRGDPAPQRPAASQADQLGVQQPRTARGSSHQATPGGPGVPEPPATRSDLVDDESQPPEGHLPALLGTRRFDGRRLRRRPDRHMWLSRLVAAGSVERVNWWLGRPPRRGAPGGELAGGQRR